MTRFLATVRAATDTAEAVLLAPVDHRLGKSEKAPARAVEERPYPAQAHEVTTIGQDRHLLRTAEYDGMFSVNRIADSQRGL